MTGLGDGLSNPLDVITSMAFALRGRPGAYAVLAGSGLSTGAGVPTGWKMVELLIREVAAVRRADVGDDPIGWFQSATGDAPTYSTLIEALGHTGAERQAIVDRLIDGQGDSRQPSPAHRSLARLVSGGWVRVVVTTNFDRLLERALIDEGIEATIITPENVVGVVPLAHSGPTIVKLHGDQKGRIVLNTEVELTEYDPEVDRLLDQVLDEYGLIVCGWSADSDTALRKAIERCSNHRFTTLWSSYPEPSENTKELIGLRRADQVDGLDADRLFGELADACEALRSVNAPSSLSVATSIAVAKQELAGGQTAISLHDRFRSEVERVRALAILQPDGRNPGNDQVQVIETFVIESELLVALTGTLAYWGTPETDRWWTGEVVRMARPVRIGGSMNVLNRPRLPALAMSWAAGTAAVAAQRDDLLSTLFGLEAVPHGFHGAEVPAALAVTPEVIHVHDEVSHIYRLLRRQFVDHLALGRDGFVEAWERWQYLILLAQLNFPDTYITSYANGVRVDGFDPKVPVPHRWLLGEILRLGTDHPLTRAGYFGGDVQTMYEAALTLGSNLGAQADDADHHAITRGGSGSGVLPSGVHYPGHLVGDPDERFTT